MILQQLKQYLQQHGRCRRNELARHFGMSDDGIDAMLAVWVSKGLVGKELVGCDSTDCCQNAKEVWYRWLRQDELSVTVLR